MLSDTNTINAAHAYTAAGLSVIPCKQSDKLPYAKLLPKDPETNKATWKPYQAAIASRAEVRQWFQNGASVAIVCGAVSGGLVVLDFDKEAVARELHRTWYRAVGGLAAALPIVQTGNGYQIYFRTALPIRNVKLAFYLQNPEERDPAKRSYGTLIETRGEGGYVIAPPSVHPNGRQYTLLRGDLSAIPLLSDEDTQALIDAARAFDEKPAPAPRASSSSYTSGVGVGNTTAYAARAFERELQALRTAGNGDRNSHLNRSAYSLGQLIGVGLLDQATVEQALYEAACDIGLDTDPKCGDIGIEKTIASGISAGIRKPRLIRARPQPAAGLAIEAVTETAPTPSPSRPRGRPAAYDDATLLAWLAEHSDCGAYLGTNADICAALGWTERAVQRALQRLEDQNFISRQQNGPRRSVDLEGDKITSEASERVTKIPQQAKNEGDKNSWRTTEENSDSPQSERVTKIVEASGRDLETCGEGDKNTTPAIIDTRACGLPGVINTNPPVVLELRDLTNPTGKLREKTGILSPSEQAAAQASYERSRAVAWTAIEYALSGQQHRALWELEKASAADYDGEPITPQWETWARRVVLGLPVLAAAERDAWLVRRIRRCLAEGDRWRASRLLGFMTDAGRRAFFEADEREKLQARRQQTTKGKGYGRALLPPQSQR